MEVMWKVQNWERVARGNREYSFQFGIGGGLSSGLEIPYSKRQEIKRSYNERDRSRLTAEYWVNTDPRASWRWLADVLYHEGEDSALMMVKQYLPKGMCIS